MADSTAMTIDFLRARLLAERSVSRASKERSDQLATRVLELEEQVRAAAAERRQAERAAEEVIAILESQGFCGHLSDSDVVDSGSDNDGNEEPADAARLHGEEEQELAAAQQHAPSGTPQPGGLSWKGRSLSPRKASQLKQKHRIRANFYLLASDSAPKYRMGQSCRKNKRKELRSAAPEEESGVALEEDQKRPRDGSDCTATAGLDERSSGAGNGGQYVIRHEKDAEMKRMLERQAELIGQYEAEEKAQRDWEKRFNNSRNSPKVNVVVHENGDTSERLDAGEEHGRGCARTGLVPARGSCSGSTISSKPPSESSPSGDTAHAGGKASDWSSSNFQDHTDDAASCRRRRPSGGADVESVLEALHRAKVSLRAKLSGRPLPPSQVTLALPAPGDEYRNEDDSPADYGNCSHREEELGSCASPARQEILALPPPEDHHYHDHERARLSVDDGGGGGIEIPSSTGSSPPRHEILALPAPGDDCPCEMEVGNGMKNIPSGNPGLFRLLTDSFPEDETMSGTIASYDPGSGLAEVSTKKSYYPQSSELLGIPSSDFAAMAGTCFVSRIPGRVGEEGLLETQICSSSSAVIIPFLSKMML